MALSNWATLAFNKDGKACEGTFKDKSGNGNSIIIYKNWIDILSPILWKKECRLLHPHIMRIHEGELKVFDFEIKAGRGPQSSIFVIINHHGTLQGGIGCYAHKDEIDEILSKRGRVRKEDDLWVSGMSTRNETRTRFIENITTGETIVYWDEKTQGEYDDDADYERNHIGVLPETANDYLKWVTEDVTNSDLFDEELLIRWAENCRKETHNWYNQGTLYLMKGEKTC